MNPRVHKPIIGITMGDPAGIGPEIIAKTLARPEICGLCHPLVIGDSNVMRQAIGIAGADLKVNPVNSVAGAKFVFGLMDVFDLANVDIALLQQGKISVMAGHAAFEAIRKVIELAAAREIHAVVTGPIHKEAINLAGHHFSGHTEIFAHLTETADVAMLLVHGNLRVIHVTTHIPLRQVCDHIKKERIVQVIRLIHDACQQLGIPSPRIGVAGLNPHAGDGGLFGHEERDEITPAIQEAVSMGIQAEGPIPPDTLFPKAVGGAYDGCVAMYHDQGHIPIKLIGFTWNDQAQKMSIVQGVNITLGLPIIRTSVDHGTAFEIAGKGVASPEAMVHAIEYAVMLAQHQRQNAK
jgi:4-phospho-D-threonate 3-dehydrogenase / 4-phospho-D-erythronate 3-dehydrogenase